MVSYLLFLLLLRLSRPGAAMRCGGVPRVLVAYDTLDNHTKQMAAAFAAGVNDYNYTGFGGAEAVLVEVGDPAAEFPFAAGFDALALGSPVHYANPSPACLQWLVAGLGPGWGNGTFEDVPAAVFATGGGIHQGTEGTLQGLTRALLNFGFRMVTPKVSTSGFYSSLGASAVTGTSPWKVSSGGLMWTTRPPVPPSGGPVADVFLQVARALGSKLAKEAARERREKCRTMSVQR
jgi:multimeric flavodoxin WrbA